MRRRLLAAASVVLPSVALACPACARDNGRWGQALLALMVAFPIAVGFAVVGIIRRAVEEDRP